MAPAPQAANFHGYQISFDEVELQLAQIQFYEGAPLFERAVDMAWQIIGIPSAYAHPGHYEEGAALAELLQIPALDLMSGPTEIGWAEGVTGDYRSAVLGLAPGMTVRLAGTVQKDGVQIPFEVELNLEHELQGVPVGFEIMTTSASVQLQIDPWSWTDRVDFSRLQNGAFTEDGQPYSALLRGIQSAKGYVFTKGAQ